MAWPGAFLKPAFEIVHCEDHGISEKGESRKTLAPRDRSYNIFFFEHTIFFGPLLEVWGGAQTDVGMDDTRGKNSVASFLFLPQVFQKFPVAHSLGCCLDQMQLG